VLVGGVVEDEIKHNLDAGPVGLFDEAIEVFHRTEFGVDAAVVGDVVAEVDIGRGVDGGEPERVDAEISEVAEFFGDAVQVADAAGGGVVEGARVDLIDDAVAPPERLLLHGIPPVFSMIV